MNDQTNAAHGSSSLRPDGYVPRIVDAQVSRYLTLFGAVEIAGTKWCGKTWTACAHGSSITYIDQENNLQIAKDDPRLVLEGARPHIIDEWQRVPQIWNAVRHEIDLVRKTRGAWILTGSSTPEKDDAPRHSGAGRIGRVRMLPMTLSESGDSSCAVSLRALFAGEFTPCATDSDTRALMDLCCRGGWPEAFDESAADALEVAGAYLEAICEQSAPTQGKDPSTTRSLIRSIARNLGQSPTYKTLMADMYGQHTNVSSEKTIADYLSFLKQIYLVQEVPGWLPPARSPKRLRMKPKRYFADPSLAVAALGLSPQGLLSDWQTFGLVFENLCMRDLLVYAGALPNIGGEPVRYYRDEAGLEADAVVELNDGQWAAFEFKVSESKVDEAVANLKRLRRKVMAPSGAQVKPPAFMAVITGNGEFARKVADDIYAIPIRVLCP